MLIAAPAGAQPKKPQAQQKSSQKAQKPQASQKKKNAPLRGKREKLECMLGTEDRHARIAVELIGGRVQSLAYYSKWKPRTCSVHIVRDDAYSKWEDTGNVTVVTLDEEKGAFLIDYDRRAVKFLFREVDRERFCGMEGKITGTLTVTRGRSQCELEGVMDETRPEPVREVATERPQDPAQGLRGDPSKDPAKELPKALAQEPPQEQAKDMPKEPPAVAPMAP